MQCISAIKIVALRVLGLIYAVLVGIFSIILSMASYSRDPLIYITLGSRDRGIFSLDSVTTIDYFIS